LVGVRVPDSKTLAQDIAGYDEEGGIRELNDGLPNYVKDYYNRTLYDDLYEKFLKIAEEKGGKGDPEEIADEMAEAAVQEQVDLNIAEVRKIVQAYLARQQQGRPLLPSDCRALAAHIANFTAEAGTRVDDDVAPGDIYKYTQEPGDTNAEWEFHYATVIMVDGNDHVTLENAAARVSDKFSKLQFDRTWYFEMYGPESGQSFGEKYAPAFNNQGEFARYRNA